jgi:PTS system mannose-specific IIA component
MIGILLVTHGRLAEELRLAALTIQPDIARIVAVALDWKETGADARERIAKGLTEADSGDGAVILTDMFGGTPTNLTISFLRKDRVEIVTGVNLPMVLKCSAIQKSIGSVAEMARLARDRGQRSIYVASDLLADEEAVSAAAGEAGRGASSPSGSREEP